METATYLVVHPTNRGCGLVHPSYGCGHCPHKNPIYNQAWFTQLWLWTTLPPLINPIEKDQGCNARTLPCLHAAEFRLHPVAHERLFGRQGGYCGCQRVLKGLGIQGIEYGKACRSWMIWIVHDMLIWIWESRLFLRTSWCWFTNLMNSICDHYVTGCWESKSWTSQIQNGRLWKRALLHWNWIAS